MMKVVNVKLYQLFGFICEGI